MRVLLLTQLFQPEPNFLKGIAFARELVRRGHEVEVLTGFPNYPAGRLYPGYRFRPWMSENIDGILIHRIGSFLSHDGSGLRRALAYLTFAFAAACLGPWLVRRPEVVHVYQGPASLMLPALTLRLRHRSRILLDIQDLWPESVFASGMYRLRWGRRLLRKLCDVTHRCASRIVVLSEGYARTLRERGVPADKIEVVYNWCDEAVPWHQQVTSEQRVRLGFPQCFTLVYTGLLGPVQALDAAIHAAAGFQNTETPMQLLLVGSGIDEIRLRGIADACGARNVRFVGRRAPDEIPAYLAASDAVFIHLKNDSLGRIGIPSKTQTYLAAGRPILAAARGEVAELISHAGAGICCEPEDPESIASGIRRLMKMSREEREQLGENGRRFYWKNLAFAVGMDRVERVLKETWQGVHHRRIPEMESVRAD